MNEAYPWAGDTSTPLDGAVQLLLGGITYISAEQGMHGKHALCLAASAVQALLDLAGMLSRLTSPACISWGSSTRRCAARQTGAAQHTWLGRDA